MTSNQSYSRANPSPRYRALVALYGQMHVEGDVHHGIAPMRTFSGQSILPHLQTIKGMILKHGVRTVLDYGAGKGLQYGPLNIETDAGVRFGNVRDYWGVERIACYDPGNAAFSALPEGTFDAVICTDVLEHCPEEDIDWILAELFSYAERFVYATVAMFPAAKTLRNGENAHCTVRPIEWWRPRILAAAATRPAVRYKFELYRKAPTIDPTKLSVAPEIVEG